MEKIEFIKDDLDYIQLVKGMHRADLMYLYLASKISADNPSPFAKESLYETRDALVQMIQDGDSGIKAETLEKYLEGANKCIEFLENIAKRNERKLVVSRIKTPDGTILESRHVHDFVGHTDANGDYYFLDGGTQYQRTSINAVPAEDVSIYTDSPFEEIREHLKRGTFDKEGYRIWKPLKDLSDKHLENILVYNKERGWDNSTFSEMVRREIEYRAANGITVEDDWDGGGE